MEIRVLASSSKGNCTHLFDGTTAILLDCGLSFKRIQKELNYSTSGIAGVLVTHSHMDHCRGVAEAMKRGLNCYLTEETLEALHLEGHRARIITPQKQFAIGSLSIMPFATQHDCPGSVGFLVASKAGKKCLYLTDSFYSRFSFRGLTHICIECNYADDILAANLEAGAVPRALRNRLLQSHFSLANVKEFLRANDLSRVEQIWLLHLSDGNSDAARFRREVMELTGRPTYIAGGGTI